MTGTGRRGIAGACLLCTVVAVALWALLGLPQAGIAGATAWLGGLLLWRDVARGTRWQAGILVGTGVVTGLIAVALDGTVQPTIALSSNAALIAMLAAVGFLRLITSPVSGGHAGPRPAGRGAIARTLLGLHLFGAIVNLSTVFIMAARMVGPGERLDQRQFRLLTRGFAAAAFWSPFFAAMATALTYAPGAKPWVLIALGTPVAAIALVVTGITLMRDQPETFIGYPMNWGSLWLPALMAAIVIGVHALTPNVSILALIAAAAPTLALLVMAARGEHAVSRFRRHVTARLPTMANELWLFLAAGVMTAGVAALIRALPVWLPFARFEGPQAAMVLVFMVALAIVGVHPVVGIALMATVLQPLQPDPTLLAMTFLAAWAIGVAVSPLSGMNLALQGAYGVRPSEVLRANGLYAVIMLAVASAVLIAYSGTVT